MRGGGGGGGGGGGVESVCIIDVVEVGGTRMGKQFPQT